MKSWNWLALILPRRILVIFQSCCCGRRFYSSDIFVVFVWLKVRNLEAHFKRTARNPTLLFNKRAFNRPRLMAF